MMTSERYMRGPQVCDVTILKIPLHDLISDQCACSQSAHILMLMLNAHAHANIHCEQTHSGDLMIT